MTSLHWKRRNHHIISEGATWNPLPKRCRAPFQPALGPCVLRGKGPCLFWIKLFPEPLPVLCWTGFCSPEPALLGAWQSHSGSKYTENHLLQLLQARESKSLSAYQNNGGNTPSPFPFHFQSGNRRKICILGQDSLIFFLFHVSCRILTLQDKISRKPALNGRLYK